MASNSRYFVSTEATPTVENPTKILANGKTNNIKKYVEVTPADLAGLTLTGDTKHLVLTNKSAFTHYNTLGVIDATGTDASGIDLLAKLDSSLIVGNDTFKAAVAKMPALPIDTFIK